MAHLVCLGEFMTIGEEEAAHFLRDSLPETWFVICNKTFVTRKGASWEIDEVVVGSHHVFIVEVKSIHGTIRGTEESWVLPNGESFRSPLSKVDQLARMVAGYLREAMPRTQELRRHFVTGLVVLTSDAEVRIMDPRRNSQVVHLPRAPQALLEMDEKAQVHFAPYRDAVLERLRALADAPKLPRQINAYRVLERLEDGPNYFSVLAEHEMGGGQALRRLKLYRLSDWRTGDERRRQRELVTRDFAALAKLSDLRCVAQAEPPFYWQDEQFLVVPYLIPPGKSLRALQMEGSRFSPTQAVRIASAMLGRLAQIHDAGVLHRNLSPGAVYIDDMEASEPTVTFADFDFARIAGADSISADADPFLADTSPYVAPECRRSLLFATEASDVFAAGVILFELLSGQQAADYLGRDGVLMLPDTPLQESSLPEEFQENVALAICDMTSGDPAKRCQAASNALEWLERALEPMLAEEAPPESPASKGEMIAERYRLLRVLGKGATAVTLLVEDTFAGGQYVLKIIRQREWAQRLALAEFQALQSIPEHPGLVRVYEVWPADNPYHLKMGYAEGPTLEELSTDFPWPLDQATNFARQLLSAVGHLGKHGLYHRDISPRNIIVGRDGPRLVDFGLARRADEASGSSVGTLLFRPPEVDRNEPWHATSDLFSAAAVLYWVFTGIRPFCADDFPIDKSQAAAPDPEVSERLGQPLLRVFARALSEDPGGRYQSADDLFEAIAQAVAERESGGPVHGERCVNEWIAEVQATYRNCRHGNAENRGLDSDFAEATYVPTRLDTALAPAILDQRQFVAVFLTGNPGDGKTAFLDRLGQRLRDRGAQEHCLSANGWCYEVEGHTFSANYDASESHRDKSSNEVLTELFQPLKGGDPPATSLRHTIVVAINDGRLRDFFLDNRDFRWLGQQLSRIQTPEASGDADPRVLVVDLKQRSLVDAAVGGTATDCLFDRILLSFLRPDRWAVCETCRARHVCPMKFNADTLRDPEGGSVIRARLKALFQIAHARRRRHITIRDLRSALSYALVGVRTCEEVHAAVDEGPAPLDWTDDLYFSAVFNPHREPDELLSEMAEFDPAAVASPRLERFLHYRRRASQSASVEQRLLTVPARAPQPVRGIAYEALGREWYRVMKRRFLLEASETDGLDAEQDVGTWQELLPYRHFGRFMRVLRGEEDDMGSLLEDVCQGVSCSEGIVDPVVQQGHLCIRTNYSAQEELTVFKRFPLDCFTCRLVHGTAGQWVEALPLGLRVAWADEDPYLDIGLDLFEFLMRLREGYRADTPELQPFVVDLALFKTRLLSLETQELVLMEAGRRLHRVTQSGGVVRLEDLSAQPTP